MSASPVPLTELQQREEVFHLISTNVTHMFFYKQPVYEQAVLGG